MNKFFEDMGASQLLEYLKSIESRIQKIESRLDISSSSETSLITELENSQTNNNEPDSFEFNLGEFWFARVGVFILAVGFAFLLTLPYDNINPFLPSLIGFIISGLLFIASKFWKNIFINLSAHLWGAAFLLLYFSTFRLFHFAEHPALSNALIEAGSLFIVVSFCFFMLRFKSSPYLTAVTLTLFGVTLIILNVTWLILILNPILAALFVYNYKKFKKIFFILYGIALTYGIHLIWALNNPFHGGGITLINEPAYNLPIILIYTLIFSLVYLRNEDIKIEPGNFIFITLFNALTGFVLFQLINLVNTGWDSFLPQVILFAVYITISIRSFYKIKTQLPVTIYALLAFASLSIGIIRFTDLPDVYIYLIWQSLIVAGTAIWFKSKKIIVANFLIFLLIFVAYLAAAGSFQLISLSFGIVALISARLLNWQKTRLTLQTEMMRNVYLSVAFVSIPFTLLKSVPEEYVGLSWLAVALIYYLLSGYLHNLKYRWMAHLTLVATILFSLAMGVSGQISILKVITILASGAVFVGVSIFFAKLRIQKQGMINN